MNRFDRVTSILLLLQTRSIVTAQFLAAHFSVSERTIYRDIRTLETAGIPISSEAGVGYFLQRDYQLAPVNFTLDEAAALLLAEKLLVSALDSESRQDFNQALNKIRAVIDHSDKDQLITLDNDTQAIPTGSHFPLDSAQNTIQNTAQNTQRASASEDRWLRECRQALLRCQVIQIGYQAASTLGNKSSAPATRDIEPIGLFYYHWHWHLIGWCRNRNDYRDFRLDRIQTLSALNEQFPRHSRLSLQQYIDSRHQQDDLHHIKLLFNHSIKHFVQEQRYLFGFIREETNAEGVIMYFSTSMPEYMARWLLQYTHNVYVLEGDIIRQELQKLTAELQAHW